MVGLRRRRRPARGLLSTLLLVNLPPGMRFALESRAHTVFTIVIVAALIGTGIISIRWEEAGPELEFHQDRARIVGGRVVDRFRDHSWLQRDQYEDQEWFDIDFPDQWATWDTERNHDFSSTRSPSPDWSPPSIARATRGMVSERDLYRNDAEIPNVDNSSNARNRVGSFDARGGRGDWR